MAARLVFALLLTIVTSLARADLVEGMHYERLNPPQTPGSTSKVEVIEFFSYGCPHCYQLHPLLTKWQAELPANAVLVRVPVSLGHRQWGQLVRAYYALEATGDLARLDNALFDAIHKEGHPLYDVDNLAVWAAQHGVDAIKFRNQFNSAEVTAKAMRAEQMSRDYKIGGVPSINVAGKYVALGRSYEDMLKSARQLIDKAAQERQAQR